MCGVAGFYSENPTREQIDLLQDIIKQSKIRGLHSFGFSYVSKTLNTVKHHELDRIRFPLANKIIYHNRYSTSGDYQNHNNNQPIVTPQAALVFNGVLDMGTKQEMEARHGIILHTDNDGEIVLKKYGISPHKLEQFIQETSGSFAGLILTRANTLLVTRNTKRPLWRLSHQGGLYFASTKDIFKRVNEEFEPEELEPGKVYQY